MKTAVIPSLRAHAPFDEMEVGALDFLAARLQLAYYPRRQMVIGPENGVADRSARPAHRGSARSSGSCRCEFDQRIAW